MIEQLFGSKTRVKLLQLFYSNPNRSFYVREITRKIDEQINSVRRELSNLLSIGIISSDTNNNRLYYEVNQSYEYFQPLSMIFGSGVRDMSKGTVKDPATDVKSLGNVELALYTGHFTRDENSGIDMLIVGDVNQTKVTKFVADTEREEGQELRFTVMTPKEFAYRQRVNDRFLAVVLGSKVQVVVDKKQVLSTKPRPTKAKVSEKKKE
jgi:hypothetical protein